MPAWALAVIGVATVVAALGVIWRQFVKPMSLAIAEAHETVPVMRALTAAFGGDPNVLAVLESISAQFRTDSGSSLRDVVNSLAEAAEANRISNEHLRVLLKALTEKVDDKQ